jgi:hypothetical protein
LAPRRIDWRQTASRKVTLTLKEFVVKQSPADNKLMSEEGDIVDIRHQATTDEDIANRKILMCAVVKVIYEV